MAEPEGLAVLPVAVPSIAEVWDEEARDYAWQQIQMLLREGDQAGAALLLSQLNAQGGAPGAGQTSASASGPQPHDPSALYAMLAYHYHFSDKEMHLMDYRRRAAYIRELTLILERQRSPHPSAYLKTSSLREEEQEAIKVALAPSIYSGPVVPIN